MQLESLLPLIGADPALSRAAASTATRLDIPMPRGVVPPALAYLAGSGGPGGPGGFSGPGGPTGPSGSSGPTGSTAAHPLHVAITASGREAEILEGAMRAYLPAEQIAVFPSWETLPHERLSPRSDTVARRLLTLRRLAHPEEFEPLRLLIMPVRALLQPITRGLGDLAPVRLRLREDAPMEEVENALVNAAYTRVDMVERRGQFAVRGGILDVFPPTERHPIRVEFFGDTVDEIRTFSVGDQRSMEEREEIYAPPCREILLTESVRTRARSLISELPGATDMLDKIAAGIAPEGMESLTPVLVDGMDAVVDVLPADARLLIIEPERVDQRAESLIATTEEFLAAAWSAAAAGGTPPVQANAASFASVAATREAALTRGQAWWTLGGFSGNALSGNALPGNVTSTAGTFKNDDAGAAVAAREPRKFLGKVDEALAAIGEQARRGVRQVLVVDGPGLARRYAEQLGELGVPASAVAEVPTHLDSGVVYVVAAPIAEGFVLEGQQLGVYAGADLTGRGGSSTRDMRALPKRRRKNAVDPLSLTPGDFVVHDRHGVGRFVRMEKRAIGGKGGQREYIVLEYAPSRRGGPPDQLWVPTDQLDQVSKYSGGESPSLNKMGGADWEKTKSKARAATRKIAAELIRLYAQRMATPGIAFSPDTPWQRELEDAFAYVETPDQLHTIDEVKADMEKPVPMDRLISGDVGYGKTEIAVRAAFKAVQDGRQVAVLVPTTLLVEQHRETFEERYAGFPVRVAALSRFQNARESEEVIAGLADGTIDVVIGTHRLLTGNVRFKALGLVVIDEEQRFGVEHKETLKQMYPNIDVLSMSATPIPRTLEMAVTGVREMSTLATPPEERHPILTYVGARENRQISAAIRRELLRDGQVFYVHNRVGDMGRVAAQLGELVPEARIAVAHGKMSERDLENVIQNFWEHEIDVLICTTIVETGLDISNANTLIVDNADKLGLSQLHQLRGRVGRGRERAYAYFLYDPDRALTETSLERLRTIAANTDLGAGTQVAMKDLEIRGAGNMLGGEQSGHIEGVGFDLYVRMVSEAVAKIRGEIPSDDDASSDVRIELPVEAYLPEDYVPSERLRLEIYTKLAASRGEDQREEIRAELRDRYGEIPEVAARLFRIAQLRDLARSAGLEEITQMGRNVRFAPVALPDSRQARLKRLYPGAMLKPAVRVLMVPVPPAQVGGAMSARPGVMGAAQTSARLGTGAPMEGDELLEWVSRLVTAVFISSVG
ncbi:transcription-repair coupling factor [Actinotignum sanguinis]|uniref:Transcription-repair-coupling factor n=1 Tax=Schaalia turicensis TaxID=131111 RepID=A0ABZ0RB74_9ACTO|nr:transcription-repair coupling factor [Actinotignum sanguinis]WPJ88366.1 transcription-repair coupling factor [Schaalia turicensis]MDK7196758.1 transcription-repair coupling factor [Actinotignum sanguinis]MDK8353357.1 transcription-repair coupling factor [Actinotignum sanguinis]MDK8511864.1 transcription-repair coupling factor [Actinotignum sanguinis]MDK8518845.1 transcription-repair coupling factor [Actinotignum sanguinis]